VAGAPVAGAVLRADRRPAALALVRLEVRGHATRWVETDAEGKFTIPHAPSGRASLVADGGDAGFVVKPDVRLPLASGKTLSVSLALPAALEGRIVDEKTGRPVPRARLHLKSTDFARLVRVGPDGTFRLKGLPPRAYRVAVDDARYVPWTHAGVALAPARARSRGCCAPRARAARRSRSARSRTARSGRRASPPATTSASS
jgi:hypothetical protein